MEMRFGQRLALARAYRRMTQAQLAEKAGLSRVHISNLEKSYNNAGTRPYAETVDKLACALDIDPGWLATGYGEMINE